MNIKIGEVTSEMTADVKKTEDMNSNSHFDLGQTRDRGGS